MSGRTPLSRPSWISLLLAPPILPFLLPFAAADADLFNITVDDTSSAIVYSPASSWHASSVPCSTCLAPPSTIAFKGTWHDGTHIIPTVDADDLPKDTQAEQPSTSEPPKISGSGKGGDDDDADDSDDDGKDHTDKKVSRRLASPSSCLVDKRSPDINPQSNPFLTPNFDSDDAGFQDHNVSAQFNFTGSAVYIYALIPLGAAPSANSTPTFMNLTFTIDSHPAGIYQHTGAASASGFLPSQLVFGQTDLAEVPHTLSVLVGPDSVLLLDYIVYTRNQENSSNSGFGPTSLNSVPEAQKTGSGTGSSAPTAGPGTARLSPKAHNIATFAGAVGGSVGLLAVLALSLAISIYRRRLRAARRDRHRRSQNHSDLDFDGESESFHTNGSEDSPAMQGPTPFVPRYFPGTVVPAPPPPYSPPTDATMALLSSASPISWQPPRLPAPGEDTSYADRPPSTPPLPEDGLDDYFAPPSFTAAISSPIPAILAGYSPVATASAPVSTSPVPLHTNGSGSRGVYATDSPTSRSRANSDAHSQRSDWSDRPPSFASHAPPLIPLPHNGSAHGQQEEREEALPQRRPDEDRMSVRSALSARSR